MQNGFKGQVLRCNWKCATAVLGGEGLQQQKRRQKRNVETKEDINLNA